MLDLDYAYDGDNLGWSIFEHPGFYLSAMDKDDGSVIFIGACKLPHILRRTES